MFPASVARELDRLGLVTFDAEGADCFLEDIAPTPPDAVGIYSRAGTAPDPKHAYDEPGFQIVVRSDGLGGKARGGWDRAQDILDALHARKHVTWGAGTADELRVIECTAAQSAPLSLGDDVDGQPRWSVLYRLQAHRPGGVREA